MKNQEEIKKLANQCVACGLCLPVCPTYNKTQSELDSPRGRIALMKGVSENTIEINEKFKEHIHRCLSCGACENVCPSKVNYLEMIDLTKENIPEESFILKHFSKINKILKFIPLYPPVFTPDIRYFPPRKQTIDLFLGCVARLFDFSTLRATGRILSFLGYNVRIHSDQNCCGAIYQHAGYSEKSEAFAKQNQKAFEDSKTVIFTATGCGSNLKDQLGEKAIEINDFLIQNHLDDLKIMLEKGFNPNANIKKIAVHEPCTHKNQLKNSKSSYELLKLIPNLEINPLEESDKNQCCGGAGIYFLSHQDISEQLLNDKIQEIKNASCDVVSTTNVGCALQLKRSNLVKIYHPVKLLSLFVK